MLKAVHIKGYRSVRSQYFPIEPLTLFVGRNGVGKTNLYRALQLLHGAATGTITRMIAEEGGVTSVFWAGRRVHKQPVRLILSVELGTIDSSVEIGLPRMKTDGFGNIDTIEAALDLEPRVKEEELSFRRGGKKLVMMKRDGDTVRLRNTAGRLAVQAQRLLASETALASFRDPSRFPELEVARRELAEWRFYDQFRTDALSPIRKSALAISTPGLASDGSDLAAVLATVFHITEDPADIHDAIANAFPRAQLGVHVADGLASFAMQMPDMPRPFVAQELSDGTLRYLCLIGALLSYRSPPFIALNEPEASLHPDLVEPLADLICRASRHSQVWVVTHSERLAAALGRAAGIRSLSMEKDRDGGTIIAGLKASGTFRDDDDEDE
jgi:predicted ATPase